MFFNGLIRSYGNLDASILSEFVNDFITKQQGARFDSTISLFNDSQWMILDIAYKNPTSLKLYVEPPVGYHRIVEQMIALIGSEYYPVQSMIAWMPPGTEVSKHVDLQKIYASTRRLHVQLLQTPQSNMILYAGNQEYKFNMDVGSVYELNNRTYHSAKNNGTEDYYALLIVDFALKGQVFTEQDNVDKDLNIPNSMNIPIYSYH
jgi:hypothetical protein